MSAVYPGYNISKLIRFSGRYDGWSHSSIIGLQTLLENQKNMMKNLQNMLLLIGVSSCMAILAGNDHESSVNNDNDVTAHSDDDEVRKPARIIRGPKTEEMASKGSNVTMNCKVEHSTGSQITWEFNNTEIIQGKKFMLNHNNGDLVVRNWEPQDQGTYRCRVSSDGGVDDFREGQLVVVDSTTIVDGPEDGLVEVWSRVDMNCTVLYDMEENLTVTWYKDGRMLGGIQYQEQDITFGRNTHYGLILSNVTMDDAGNYTCWARTNSSEHRVSGKLDVFGIPPSLSGLESLEAMEGLEGDDIVLECRVEKGYPNPLVSWYKDDAPVKVGEHFQVGEDNSLVINQSDLIDSGVYKCVAENEAGEESREVRVDVLGKTFIGNKPNSFVLNEGREVVIGCDVVVDPNLERYLTVSWFKDEEELNNIAKLQPVFGGMEGAELNVFQMYQEGSGNKGSEDKEDDDRIVLMANNSLKIFKMKEGDLGEYTCKANINKDGLEDVVISEANKIYIEALFPWWIIVIPFLIIIIVVIIAVIVICRLRKGLAVKGNYNVNDIEGNTKKLKKTDIYYLPSDLDYDSFINACTQTTGQTPCCGNRNVQQQVHQSARNYEHLS